MATEALIGNLTELVSIVLNEARYALDFEDQFQGLKKKLENMKAFLSHSENLTSRGEVLQQVLVNLRKLMFEADDILTDCQVRAEYREDIPACTCLSPHQLFFLYRTGKILNEINARIQNMESMLNISLMTEMSTKRINDANQLKRYSSQNYIPSEIVGLEEDLEKIKWWIRGNNEEHFRIGIVGMGGLGKTTIAQKIFNDGSIVASFDKMIWVPVSNDFTEQEIMRVMLKQLGHEYSECDELNMLSQIHDILNGKKCLIIMDDIWRVDLDWWNKLCHVSGWVIIITSRNVDVTKSMGVDESRIHRPRTLNEEESWSLFCKFAFRKGRRKCPNNIDDEFKRVGRSILDKCGGLPLAIKTIGALLAPKVDSLSEWKNIARNFHELTTKEQNSSVMASLQLSYDELPTYLKPCLLCFSIYPEDFEINAEQIILWWVGDGFIHGKDTRTAIELGYDYLSELASRCLIDIVDRRGYDGRIFSCKMHDLVRDMTMKIAKDEGFCSFNEQGQQKFTEGSRWLGFNCKNLEPLKRSPKLRALLINSTNPVSFHSNAALLRSVRALDFSKIKIESNKVADLLDWIFSLERLAYLNLSGVSGLKEVPCSIRKLRNLQILVLRNCNNLAELHPSITYLKMLIVLDLRSCKLQYLPNGLEKLTHLQELSGFKLVSQPNMKACRLLDLLKLQQLRVLRMNINNKSGISEEEGDVLSQLPTLNVLAIHAEDCKEGRVAKILDHLSPPPSLQELYLRHYRHETLPKWINPKQLPSLQYLCLEDGDVNQLRSVNDECEDVRGRKWILEGLRLMFMPHLVLDWKNLEKDMPFLLHAEVSHCFNLRNFPHPKDKKFVWRKNARDEELSHENQDGN